VKRVGVVMVWVGINGGVEVRDVVDELDEVR